MATVLDYDAAATPRRLQVGAGVGVDFHADGDFDDARCFPSHSGSPWSWTQDDVEDSKTWHALRTRWHACGDAHASDQGRDRSDEECDGPVYLRKPFMVCQKRIIAACALRNLWMDSI
jgi:hypothetical protein